MTTTPPPDIDRQVAAFREQLATATALDTSQLSRDVQQLAEAIINAPTHHQASAAVHDVAEGHAPEYAHAVIVGALSAFAVTALINADSAALGGVQGHLARLVNVAWTIRNLGITTTTLNYFIGSETL